MTATHTTFVIRKKIKLVSMVVGVGGGDGEGPGLLSSLMS